jgi:hypothetical protein
MTTLVRLRAAGLAAVIAIGLAASAPPDAAACSGRLMNFAEAIRLSDGAIYSGRIVRVDVVDGFWNALEIEIDHVARGPAAVRVGRVQAGNVCEGIRVGEYGWIVREVDDPFSATEDMFFGISESAGLGALRGAGLPDTSTAESTSSAPMNPSAWLWFWAIASFAVACLLRARQRRQRIASRK